MIAADHNRRFEFTVSDHLVEGKAEPVPLTEPHPADPGRQSLKLNSLSGRIEPVVQVRVIGNEFLDLRVRLVNIVGIAR